MRSVPRLRSRRSRYTTLPGGSTFQVRTERHGITKRRDNRPVIAGMIFGFGLGVVVFAITQNPIWVGFGAGLGIVAGAVFEVMRP